MSYKVLPPDLKDCKSYEVYLKELTIWETITDVPKAKQGAILAARLPNESKLKKDLKDKFFESVNVIDLAKEGGLELVKGFLEKELGEDDLEKQVRTWDSFEDCTRGTKDIEDFLSDYDRAYKKAAAAAKIVIPASVRAFMVLKRANIDRTQRMLVLSKLDKNDETKMFDNMCKELKIVLGSGPGASKSDSNAAIKTEQSILPSEEVLYAAGYYRRGGGQGYRGGRGARGSGRGGYAGNGSQNHGGGKFEQTRDHNKPYEKPRRKMNRPGDDGNPTTCHHCGSKFHYMNKCPDREESVKVVTHDEHTEAEIILFTDDKAELSQFTQEALNCAALDTCCSSTVSGKEWLDIYLNSIDKARKEKVEGPFNSDKIFKFGNNGRLPSKGRYLVPATLAGTSVTIGVDVIDSDIPLLLSKQAMKKAGMNIDLQNDVATVFGKEEKLITTTCGHYCMPLLGEADDGIEKVIEEVLAIDLENIAEKDQIKAMEKLHKQFGHTSKEKFVNFMKDAKAWHAGLEKHLDNIISQCVGCIKKKRNPAKPVVGLPMAKEFNEKVAIDLKKWNNKYILHMVDMFSRLTISCFIERKTPREVIDKIMEKWIGYFGVMRCILNDNGGEFTGNEIKEVKDILNVVDLTTGAESPWMNGLCEKNHALVDSMLERMVEDYPNIPDHVLLGWANMAKNSMQMVYGFSSNQLVYGTNPNLPNIMSNGLPAMEGKTSSEIFAQHFNALQAARKAFTESENSERVRKALMRKVCTSITDYDNGDIVWYKRERDGQWKGPAKVIFQDGKVVWVRHGASAVRVSVNRIVKQGQEITKQVNKDENMEDSEFKLPGKSCENDDANIEREVEDIDDADSEERAATEIAENVEITPELDFQMDNDIETIDEGRKRKASENEEAETRTNKRSRAEGHHPPSRAEKIQLKRDDLIQINLDDGEWLGATVIDRAKVSGKYYNYFNVLGEDGLERNVDLERLDYRKMTEEEVNMVQIPREEQSSEECKRAKIVELEKLKNFDSFEEVDDMGQYRISCRWILWKKGTEVRARLVARGFEEPEEVPSDSPTVDKCNIRLALAIAASKGWNIKCSDVKSAFLQGKQLERLVTMTPPREANVTKGKLWKLKVALYGLDDASLQFFFKCKEELLKLGCKQSTHDPALFFKKNHTNELIGIIVLHVDDFLHAGNELFEETVSDKLADVYTMGKVEEKQFTYVGFDINQTEDGITIDQSQYAEEKIDNIIIDPDRAKNQNDELSDEEKSLLRRIAGRIGWLARGTRPDLTFAQIDISTKFVSGKVRDLIEAAKSLRKAKSGECFLLIRGLGPVSGWWLEVWTDASLFTLNDGVNSTGATLILLVNENDICVPVVWQANKIKRIVRSSLEAECLALVEGLKEATFMRDVVEEVFGLKERSIPVRAIIDNKSTVDAVHSTAAVSDKKLRRDIGIVKQMLNEGDVTSLAWCQGKDQLADLMTKKTASPFNLLSVFQKGRRYLAKV